MREIDRGVVSIPQTYDLNHLRAIHRHLFQDVYDWAGEVRDVRIQKSEDSEFAKPRRGEIHELIDQVHGFVQDIDWERIDRQRFVNSTATAFAYLNQAHPFREGNGRTTQVFLRDIAAQSPFTLDFTKVDRDAWDEASAQSSPRGDRTWIDPRPLVPLFKAATHGTPPPTRPAPDRSINVNPNTGPVTGNGPDNIYDGPHL
ncbi:Fic/DOC family protein [Microbacterium sp. 179-I 3D4 NHS]|uniref:Fic/DOC family protein n=1 Tax=Microbacterium sp. 179-I 3D4 NHS TaxID=3142381 RepID=UPI00399EEC91